MKAYQKGAVATLAALALTLTACGGGSGTKPADEGGKKADSNKTAKADWNPQPRDALKDGGTLTTAIGEITENLNAWADTMTTDTRTIWGWYNPTPFYYTPEGEWKWDSAYIAEQPKEEVKDGATVVTYKLNKKAVYNDGTPIDYTSFEAAWKACSGADEKYSCNSTDGYNKIKSVAKGADNFEVVVTFKGAYPWYKGLFNDLLHPKALDPAVFAEGYANGESRPELGAGPFKVEKISRKDGVASFVRNEKWWGDAPKLEKRTFLVRSGSAAIQAFKNGETDAAGVTNKDLLAQVKDMNTIDIRRGAYTGTSLITLNSDSPMLKDIKVREAVFTAINRQTIMDIAFQGLDYAEEAPGSLQIFPWQKGYKDAFSAVVKYDPEKAGKILDEAGWAKGSDGIRTKDGKQLALTLPYFGDLPLTKARVQAIQAMLQQVGIKLNLDNHPSSDFAKVIKDKSWDVMFSGFGASDPFGAAYMCQVYCTTKKSGSTLNKSNTQNAEIDAMIDKLEAMPNADDQLAELPKIEEAAFRTFGLMPVYNGPIIMATKKGLANYGSSVFGSAPKQDIGWQK